MSRPFRLAVKLVPVLASFGLLAFALRRAHVGRAFDLVDSLGWAPLPLLLLPNLLVMLLEATGWWIALDRLAVRPRLHALLLLRMVGEALMLGLPSGTMVNESMQPYLLKRRCGLALESAVVATIARKFFVVLSHGLFLALSTLAAWSTLDRFSRAAIGRGGLPWLLLAAAAGLVIVSLLAALASARGRVADRIRRRLDVWGGRRLGTWLERNTARFLRADEALASFFTRAPAGLAPPLLAYLLGWLVRAGETLLFLRLLGVPAALPVAMVIETSLILLRAMAVPLPAGLGVQDVGYVLALRALGVPAGPGAATAFVMLKRGKDLFWVVVGFLVLGLGRRRDTTHA